MNAFIKAISYYLPEKTLSNEELVSQFPEWSVEKVAKKVGVNIRHISAPEETAGDMAIKAAKSLFTEYNIDPRTIDFILFCTQSPDYHLPTTACIIQNALGITTRCGALDFNLGCSGYVYGLSLTKGLILAGIAKNVLLLTGETYTKYAHLKDKGNRSIFGDGASASLISTDGFAEIGNFSLGTDGAGAENLIVKTGCSRNPDKKHSETIDEGGAIQSTDHLYMNGSEIFNFTLEAVPPLVDDVIAKNNLTPDDITYTIFHQANKFMLDTLRKVCGFSKEKYYVNLEETGNTVSSTLPIALKDAMAKDMVKKGYNVLIAGFGVGYSWGATILKF